MGLIAGVLGGALLGSKASKKQQTSSSVQKAEPWEGVQPHLRSLYDQTANLGAQTYYPGSTVADQSWNTQHAMNMIRDRATTPDPTMGAANRNLQSTIAGDYLFKNPAMGELGRIGSGRYLNSNPAMGYLSGVASGDMLNSNPYLDSMFDQAAGRVGDQFRKHTMPGIDSGFSLGGRYGSNAHQEAIGGAQQRFGDTLNNLATDIYGGNYARERGAMDAAAGTIGSLYGQERGLQNSALGMQGNIFGGERQLQQQATGMAPEFQAASYLPAHQLMAVGAQQDAFNQAKLNDEVARHNFNQNAERDRLAFQSGIYSGAANYGTKTGTQTQGSNPIMGAMGGAMMGGALGNMMMPMMMASSMAGGMGGNPYMYSNGGWGTGNAYGNQDMGLFL